MIKKRITKCRYCKARFFVGIYFSLKRFRGIQFSRLVLFPHYIHTIWQFPRIRFSRIFTIRENGSPRNRNRFYRIFSYLYLSLVMMCLCYIPRRLDYFVLSDRLKNHLIDSVIRDAVMGSDHCPVVLSLSV